MRQIALALAVLVSLSALDARVVVGQASDTLKLRSLSWTALDRAAAGGLLDRSSSQVRPLIASATPGLAQRSVESATSVFENPSRPARHRSALRVVLYTAGGVILGSWAGYVASQIVRSDWNDAPGRGAQRLRFSLAGGGVGLVGGFLIGRMRSGDGQGVAKPPPAPRQRPITEEEISSSTARSLTQLLREMRPQWLRDRGVDVIRPNRDPAKGSGVRVYLNGGLLGGLDTLDDVSVDAVTRIEFLDPEAAVLRWGTGHEDGAILLTTTP